MYHVSVFLFQVDQTCPENVEWLGQASEIHIFWLTLQYVSSGFVAGSLQGHWWGFLSWNYVVWPIFFLMNVFIALELIFDFYLPGALDTKKTTTQSW